MTHYWWKERIGRHYAHAYRVFLIYEERTPAGQHLLILKNPLWGRFLVLDGIVQFTERDEFIYHEAIVLTPMALLPFEAKRVLVIGGGDGGVVRELQRFEFVEKILQVELDLSVFEACHKYIPEISGDYRDPRVELRIEDGFSALKKFGEGEFDLVVVDSTDPVGPAKRLYTEDFYLELYRVLKEGGVFIQQASIPGFFPEVLKEAWKNASKAFSELRVLRAPVPSYGDEIAFVLGTKGWKLSAEPKRDLVGRFYNPEVHRALFALPTWWKELIRGGR